MIPDPSAAAPLPPAEVLLVSDDETLPSRLQPPLLALGLHPEWRSLCGDGPVPLRAVRHAAVLVDLRRDPVRGLGVLEGLAHRHAGLGLLALLPPGDADLPRRAFDAGADDFCIALGDGSELAARLRHLARPHSGGGAVVVGDLELDPATGRVRRAGRPLNLTPRQHELLLLLIRHAGQVLSRERIEAELALVPGERRSNLVEVHVHHLRRHLGAGRLVTLRGQGYRLVADPRVSDATERTLRE